MAEPEFWSDAESAQKVVSELKTLRRVYEPYRALEREVQDAEGLIALVEAEPDESLALELDRQSKDLLPRIQALELQSLLSEESDAHGAILTIHPGAGGTESQDWAELLYRMYSRYLERRGFPSQVLDLQPGEEAGIKDATVEVDAPFAYGYLKAERGVHRLVRISPYDANHRRHTSFASVFVYPLAGEGNGDAAIPEGDLRIDTYRASGAGHIPTGIVVTCQNERSQHRNRDSAMKILKARLYAQRIEDDKKKQEALTGGKKDIAWGNQIRSYVFHPYTLVKDHRTDLEVRDVQRVMDGDLDPFIDAYLRLKETP